MAERIESTIPSCDDRIISTLVFMDLEATGLPSLVGKRNVHITEMSFVAIDRQNFETDSTFRVINKLSLCIRPRAAVSPGAMSITGLYNDVLENQEKFDDSIPKLLDYFFRRLQKPLCLLAHNGNKYDFPLLQAELRNINYALDPQILCADTLEAIRHIVSNPSMQLNDTLAERDEGNTVQSGVVQSGGHEGERAVSPNHNIKDADEPVPDSEIESLLSQDINLFKDIVEPETEYLANHSGVPVPSGKRPVDEHTPPKSTVDCGPPRLLDHKKVKLDPMRIPKNQYKTGISTNFRHVHAKRQLFMDNKNKANSAPLKSRPDRFTLEKLYHHYFGEDPPTSHYAEADCIALSKVCQRVNKDFLEWIDENSRSFCCTAAMW